MSIRNKLVTAITTAGLLAGLFGSAFVPTASAARGDSEAPRVALTKFNAGMSDFDERYPTSHKKGGLAKLTFWAEEDAPDDDYSIGFKLNDKDDAGIETATLKAVSSNSAIQVAFAYETGGGDRVSCEDADIADAFGSTDTVEDAAGDESANQDLDTVEEDGDGSWYRLCVHADRPGTSTVTITANGVALRPVTVMALGDLVKLELTANLGTTRVAADNEGISRFFKLVGKDAAGQVINGPALSMASYGLEDWTGNSLEPIGHDDDEEVVNAKGDAIPMAYQLTWAGYTNAAETNYQYAYATLKPDTCQSESFTGANDGDEGKKYKLGFELEDYADDNIIQSNTVEITCTGAKDEFTISNPVLEYTSGAGDWAASAVADDDLDGVVGIYVTAKDANGAELGINADFGYDESDDDTFDATLGFGIDLNDFGAVGYDVVSVEPRVGADGKVMIGYVVPDVTSVVGTKFPTEVTLSDWDANYDGTASLADLKKTVTYTVGSSTATVYSAKKSWSVAHTRVVVTVAWGSVCSNAIVLFDIEKGNGDMIAAPLRRRANADGTASLVLQKRRTVNYVTAISCEALGDIEVGPVRARFK